MTIYIDVLFCVNLITDYILLLTVRKLTSLRAGRLRLLCGAVIGGLGSFVILLPPLPFIVMVLISAAEVLLMTGAVFLPVSIRAYIRVSALMFAVSFIYCGFMTAVMSLVPSGRLTVRNGSVYIDISPYLLIAVTLVCYGILRLFYGIKWSGDTGNKKCSAVIEYGGEKSELQGIIDTGSTLHEPFSGECVIVGNENSFEHMKKIKELLENPTVSDIKKGIRLIPFSSVGGSGLIPAFRPEKITIRLNNKNLRVSAYIALCSGKNMTEGCDIIVPYELVTKGS